MHFVLLLAGLLPGTGVSAGAQTDSTTRSAEARAGQTARLGVHGHVTQDCKTDQLPVVTIKTAPDHGAIVVRSGKLKAGWLKRCPSLEVPVQAVLYLPQRGYSGPDEVSYEVRFPSGKSQSHTVRLTVKTQGTLPRAPKEKAIEL